MRAIQLVIGAGTILISAYYYLTDNGNTGFRQVLEGIFGAALWIAGIEVFARTVGWIVRGFKDIPHGQDTRNGQ